MTAAPSTSTGRNPAAPASGATVDVVVVSYNTRDYLARCLGELEGCGERVFVVDSASTDGSAAFVRERFPAVDLVELPANRGFGAAANVGIGRVESDWALLLNADAWPLPGAVAGLLALAADEPGAAVVAPRLVNPDGSAQRSVFGYPTTPARLASWAALPSAVGRAFQVLRLVQRLLPPRRSPDRRVIEGDDFPAGAALLIRKGAFDEVGGFDEAFFMYSEETDLCARLRKQGWTIVLCRGAAFVHVGSASTAQAPETMYREQLRSYIRFIAKHRGRECADRARRLLATSLRLRAFASRGPGRRRRRSIADWLAAAELENLLA
jgi:GT2 family glycosyltransferase